MKKFKERLSLVSLGAKQEENLLQLETIAMLFCRRCSFKTILRILTHNSGHARAHISVVVAVEVWGRYFGVVDETDDAAGDHHEQAHHNEGHRADENGLKVVWVSEGAGDFVCIGAVIRVLGAHLAALDLGSWLFGEKMKMKYFS